MSATFDPAPLIGRPWVRGATGPDAFDCWGLIRHVEREAFGVEVPEVAPPPSRAGRVREYLTHPELARWESVAGGYHAARPGDLILLAPGTGRIEHIGVWLGLDGGGILHAAERHGVAYQSPSGIKTLWQIMDVRRLIGDAA